ncbi:MAG: porin [Pseudomonadota bacterium]
MNFKSLLLGSAAAMVAVSGAQAADAIVVEPEPVEYVRVCDAYGSGFFFIPGTETCIRLSGFVRSAYEKYYIDGVADDQAGAPTAVDRSFTLWGQRARLNVDTRNETEYGTLRALYRLEGGQSNVDVDVDMDIALISLAGFRAGFAGANYWSSNHGFGFVNAESVSSVAGGAIYTDGYYGFDDATIFDYTWAADGFSVTIGVEDPRISYALSDGAGGFTGGFGNATNNGGTDGRANFYAGFNYSGDGFGVAFTAVHDSIAVDQNDGDVGGWAYKVSATLDLSDFIPGGGLAGYYMNDGDYDTDYLHTAQTTFNPEEIWGIAFNANLTDEVQFWANYWDVQGTAITAGGPAALAFVNHGNLSTTGDLQQFGVGLNWFPSAAPGLSIKAAFYTGEIDNAISPLGNFNTPLAGATAVAQDVNADYDGFEITVRRDF